MKPPSHPSGGQAVEPVPPRAAVPPGAGEDPWIAAMRRGDFAGAWRISDAVLRTRAGIPCHHLPRHEQYLWDGTPLEGRRVLVRCYHGLGDTVQFFRFVPQLTRVASDVVVWAQPALLPLLRTMSRVGRLEPLHDGAAEFGCEVDVELMELPHAFRTTLGTLPRHVPYLHPERAPGVDAPRVPWANMPGFHVGVIWRSGEWDDRRSLPTSALAPLAGIPGVRLHALQAGPAVEEWRPEWGSVDATPDVLELARRLRALDLVLTVDSFPAHLAGALGVRTWTLLHADPDWRWMLGRDDSPWYPTMRLFRQAKPGDWAGVIARVGAALRLLSG